MTVEPGFAHQEFPDLVLPKLRLAAYDTGDPVRAIGALRAKAEHATAQAAWARPEWPPTGR